MSLDPNPYLTPATDSLPPSLPDDSETIRRQHLNHEASIKSLGVLYFLAAIFMIPGGLAGLASPAEDFSRIMAAGVLTLGILSLALGWGLRRFQSWARVGSSVVSVLGLFAFPIGTLINVMALSYLLSKKGSMVFSAEYKDIIAATPHVKHKNSIVVWILLGIFALILILVIVFAVLTSFGGKR